MKKTLFLHHPKGMTTLFSLLVLSGLLAVLLLLDDNMLSLYRAQQIQRKDYVERSLALQKRTQKQQETACLDLPLDNAEKVKQIVISMEGATDAIQHGLWCQRISLFKKAPTVRINEGTFKDFIQLENVEKLKNMLQPPPSPIKASKTPQLYWLDKTQTQWNIEGNISAIIIAEGNLTLSGKGRISGSVITQGTLTLDGVTVSYGKAVVTQLTQQYSRWQLAEKSWHDFNISTQ